MSDEQLLDDPTNRVVAVFDEHKQAEAARQEIVDQGFSADDVRVVHGDDAAKEVDVSAKWFADTDEDIQRYKRELRSGNTVVSVPVTDSVGREQLHKVLDHHNARLVTHFGQWITEIMK